MQYEAITTSIGAVRFVKTSRKSGRRGSSGLVGSLADNAEGREGEGESWKLERRAVGMFKYRADSTMHDFEDVDVTPDSDVDIVGIGKH